MNSVRHRDEPGDPITMPPSEHCLTFKYLLGWWQIKSGGIEGKKQANLSPALAGTIMPVLMMPFFVILAVMRVEQADQPAMGLNSDLLPYLLWIAVIMWSLLFSSFVYVFRHHQRYVTKVIASEKGLLLTAPIKFSRFIEWDRLEDCFLAGNEHSGYRHYVLRVTDTSESFYLSRDLTDFDVLFEKIDTQISRNKSREESDKFFLNNHFHSGYTDLMVIAPYAFFLVGVSLALNTLILDVTDMLPSLALISFGISGALFMHRSLVCTSRISKEGILIETRVSEKFIPWKEVRAVKTIVFYYWLITDKGCFLHLKDDKESRLCRVLGSREPVRALRKVEEELGQIGGLRKLHPPEPDCVPIVGFWRWLKKRFAG